MSLTAVLFAFALIDNLLLLFINIYNIISLSDLEADLINVPQCCEKLNKTFLPDAALHVMMTVFFLLNGNWFIFLFNVPIDLWVLYKVVKRPPGQLGYFDPLELNNRKNIKANLKEFLVRLAFYLIGFILYLFLLIQALI